LNSRAEELAEILFGWAFLMISNKYVFAYDTSKDIESSVSVFLLL